MTENAIYLEDNNVMRKIDYAQEITFYVCIAYCINISLK